MRDRAPASRSPFNPMMMAEGATQVFAAMATKYAIRLLSSTSATFHAGEKRRATAAVPCTR